MLSKILIEFPIKVIQADKRTFFPEMVLGAFRIIFEGIFLMLFGIPRKSEFLLSHRVRSNVRIFSKQRLL